MRTCIKCLKEKSENDFYSTMYTNNICKSCTSENNNLNYHKHKLKVSELRKYKASINKINRELAQTELLEVELLRLKGVKECTEEEAQKVAEFDVKMYGKPGRVLKLIHIKSKL